MKVSATIKRMFSILLVFYFIFVLFPTGVFAKENGNLTQEELSTLVCSAFPEYACKIMGSNISSNYTRSDATNRIVHKEVRKISDNVNVLYLEYEDGFVVYWAEQYDPDIIFDDAYGSDDILYFNCRITLSNNYNSQVFVVSDVRFQIDHSGFDSITSCGDISDSTALSTQFGFSRLNETASSPAYTSYIVTFSRSGKLPAELTIYLYVEADSYRIDY